MWRRARNLANLPLNHLLYHEPSHTTLLSRLKHHSPPINYQIRPIHIPARPTTQHHKRPRNLPRIAHPPHRIPLIPDLPRPCQPLPLIQNRIHIPRTNCIDPHARTTPLRRQALSQRQQRRLARIVRRLRLREVGRMRGDASREDDAAGCLLRDHLPRGGLRAEERARQVDVVRAAPVGGGGGERGRAAYDAGEAAEGGYGAEHFERVAHCGRDGGLGAHVDGAGRDAAVGEALVQRFDRVEGLLWVDVPEGEARGAVLEEGAGGFEGEGAGAAGDWECWMGWWEVEVGVGMGVVGGYVPCSYVLMTFPSTWNLYCALCAFDNSGGGGCGAVNGLSAVDSTISGSWRLVRDARSGLASRMIAAQVLSDCILRFRKSYKKNWPGQWPGRRC